MKRRAQFVAGPVQLEMQLRITQHTERNARKKKTAGETAVNWQRPEHDAGVYVIFLRPCLLVCDFSAKSKQILNEWKKVDGRASFVRERRTSSCCCDHLLSKLSRSQGFIFSVYLCSLCIFHFHFYISIIFCKALVDKQ